MRKRRKLLVDLSASVCLLSGCATVTDPGNEFAIESILLRNKSRDRREFDVDLSADGDTIYSEELVAESAEWEDRELVKAGGAQIDRSFSEQRDYAVKFESEAEDEFTASDIELIGDGDCVRIGGVIEPDGSFVFSYAFYESEACERSSPRERERR